MSPHPTGQQPSQEEEREIPGPPGSSGPTQRSRARCQKLAPLQREHPLGAGGERQVLPATTQAGPQWAWGEGQKGTQSPRAGREHMRKREGPRKRGSRGWAAWRQRGRAESADCAHPLAILWFLSHRWERNPPRRAELWEKLILRLRNVLPPPAREGKRNRKGTSPSVRKMSLIPHRL